MDLTNGTFVDETKETAYFADIDVKGDFLSSDTAASALFRYQKERDPNALWFGYEKADKDTLNKAVIDSIRDCLNLEHMYEGEGALNLPEYCLSTSLNPSFEPFIDESYIGKIGSQMAYKPGSYKDQQESTSYIGAYWRGFGKEAASAWPDIKRQGEYIITDQIRNIKSATDTFILYQYQRMMVSYMLNSGVNKMTPQERQEFYQNDEKYKKYDKKIKFFQNEKNMLADDKFEKAIRETYAQFKKIDDEEITELGLDKRDNDNETAYTLGAGTFSILLSVGAALLTKAKVGAALFGIMQGGELYEEMRTKGYGSNLATPIAALGGYIEGLIENASLLKFLKNMTQKTLSKAVKANAVTEFFQEGFQAASEQLLMYPFRPETTFWEKIEIIGKSAMYGAILGPLGTIATRAFVKRTARKMKVELFQKHNVELERANKLVDDAIYGGKRKKEAATKEIQQTIIISEAQKLGFSPEVSKVLSEVLYQSQKDVKSMILQIANEALDPETRNSNAGQDVEVLTPFEALTQEFDIKKKIYDTARARGVSHQEAEAAAVLTESFARTMYNITGLTPAQQWENSGNLIIEDLRAFNLLNGTFVSQESLSEEQIAALNSQDSNINGQEVNALNGQNINGAQVNTTDGQNTANTLNADEHGSSDVQTQDLNNTGEMSPAQMAKGQNLAQNTRAGDDLNVSQSGENVNHANHPIQQNGVDSYNNNQANTGARTDSSVYNSLSVTKRSVNAPNAANGKNADNQTPQNNADNPNGMGENPQHNPNKQNSDNQTPQTNSNGQNTVNAESQNTPSAPSQPQPVLSLHAQEEIKNHTDESFKKDRQKKLKSLENKKVFNESLQANIEIWASSIKNYRLFFADKSKQLIVPYLPKLLKNADFSAYKTQKPAQTHEKNIYLTSTVPVKIDHVIYEATIGLKVSDGKLALWNVGLKQAPFQTDPAANTADNMRFGLPISLDEASQNGRSVNPENNAGPIDTRINLDEAQRKDAPHVKGETVSDSQGKEQSAAKKQTQSKTPDINVQEIIDGQNALDDLILKSKKTGAFKGQAIFGKVSEWLKTKSRQMGLDLFDFTHVVHISDIKQIKNMSQASQKGGQISDADIQKLPLITANPDFAVFGTDKFNLPSVVLAKKMPNGDTLFVLQNATKNKALITKAMWKVNGDVNLSSLPAHIKRHVPFNIYKNGIQNEFSAANDKVLSETQGIKGIQEQTQKNSSDFTEETAPKIYRNTKGEELAFDESETVDTTNSYKEIEGDAKDQAESKANDHLKNLIGKPIQTAEGALKVQLNAFNNPHIVHTRFLMKRVKALRHTSILLNLEKILTYAKKIDRDGTVDLSHNTRKQTLERKEKVNQYIYFVAPVQINGEKYFVEFVTEQMKGKNPNLLELYNVRIKRSPIHTQSATVPDSKSTIAQNEGDVNTNNKNVQQNVTENDGDIKRSPRHAQLGTTVRDSSESIANNEGDVNTNNENVQQNVAENDGDIKRSPIHAQLSTTVPDSNESIAQNESDVKNTNQTNGGVVTSYNQNETETGNAQMNAGSSSAPVVSISSAQETYGLPENDHKTYLRETLQDYRDKKVFNNSLGAAIEIQTSPLNPYSTFLADENNRLIVPYVPYLLQTANFTEVQNVSDAPFGQEGYGYWTATVPVQIDGDVFDVQMNVKQTPDGRFIWDAHAQNTRPSDGSLTNTHADGQNSDKSPAAYEETHQVGQNDKTADDLNEKSASEKLIIATQPDAHTKVANSEKPVNGKTLFQRGNHLLFQVTAKVLNKFRQDLKLMGKNKSPRGSSVRLESTPFVYQVFGIKDKPVILSQQVVDKAKNAMTKDHNVPQQVIDDLPVLLADPLMVLKSATQKGDLVVVLDAVDKSGRPVFVILRKLSNSFNVIPSIYGRDNFARFLKENAEKGRVLYVKGKARDIHGAQLPEKHRRKKKLLNKDQINERYLKNLQKQNPQAGIEEANRADTQNSVPANEANQNNVSNTAQVNEEGVNYPQDAAQVNEESVNYPQGAAQVNEANQNSVSNTAQTNEVTPRTTPATNPGDKGSQNPARPTLHLRTKDEMPSQETGHLQSAENMPSRPTLHLRSAANAEPRETTSATNPSGQELAADQAAVADTLTQLQDLINTPSENERNDAYGMDETAALQTDPATNPGVEGPNALYNNTIAQEGQTVDENKTSIADELGLTSDPEIEGEVLAQSAKKSNIVDLTNEFKHNPTIKEIKAYIDEIIESGKKFGTLSPDWFIDIPHGKRNKRKILNANNYKNLNYKEINRFNKYLSALEQLLSNARYVGSKRNFKEDKKSFVEKYHYFKSDVKIGNKVYEILFDTEQFVEESETKPQTVHLYNVKEIAPGEATEGRNLTQTTSPDKQNIAQNGKNVNNNGRKVGRYVIDFTSEGWGDSEVFKQDANHTDVMDLTQHFDHIPTTQEMQAYLNEVIETGQKFSTLSPDWMVDVLGGKRVRKKILNSGDYKKLNHKGINRHNRYVMALEELLARAEYVGEQVNLKNDSKEFVEKYHYFKTPVKVGSHIYDVIFDAEQHYGDSESKPQTVHLYNISEMAPGGTGRKWQNLKQMRQKNEVSVQPTAESTRNSIDPNVRNDTDTEINAQNDGNINKKAPSTLQSTEQVHDLDTSADGARALDSEGVAIKAEVLPPFLGNKETLTEQNDVVKSQNEKNLNETEDSFDKPFVSISSQEEMQSKNADYFKVEMLQKLLAFKHSKIHNESINADIEIRPSSIKKYKSFYADKNKHLIVTYIPELLKRAHFVKEKTYTPQTERNVVNYYKAKLPVQIDNTAYNIYVTVKEDNNGLAFWDIQIKKVALQTEPATNPGVEGPKALYEKTIAQNEQDVKNKSRTNAENFTEKQQNVIENEQDVVKDEQDVTENYQEGDYENGDVEIYYQPALPPEIKNKKVKVVDLTKDFTGIPTKKALTDKIEALMGRRERLKTQSFEKYIDFKDDTGRDITGHLIESSKKNLTPEENTRRGIALNSIEDLIQESVYVEKEVNKKPWKREVEEYYRFYVPVLLGKGKSKRIYIVRLVAEKLKGEKGIRPDVVHLYDFILEDSTLPLPANYNNGNGVNEGAAVPPRSKGLSASGATTSEDASSLMDGVNGDLDTVAQNGNGVNEGAAALSEGQSPFQTDNSGNTNLSYSGANNKDGHPDSSYWSGRPKSDGLNDELTRNDGSVNKKTNESTLEGDNSVQNGSNADSELTIKVSQMLKNVQGFDKTLYRQDGARGYIIMNDVKNVIRLLQTADPSTIIHELGHYFTIRYMRALHEAGRMDELQPILGWLDIPGTEYMKLAHKERLARAFETYVMEGVAPNPRLKSLFDRFKRFLSNVYRNLVGKVIPPEQINADVRLFFDKMLAPDYDASVDVDMLGGKSDALQTVANDALQGVDSTVDGVGTNELQGLMDVMYARLPRESQRLVDMLREDGLQEDFNQLQESFEKIKDTAGGIQDILTSEKGDKAQGVIDFLIQNGFIDPTLKNDTVALTNKIGAIFKNVHKLAAPLNLEDKTKRDHILKGVRLIADVLKDLPYEDVAKALKKLRAQKNEK